MAQVEEFRDSLDGELLIVGTPGYHAARRFENWSFRDTRPSLVVLCQTEADVVRAIAHARSTGIRLVPRGGGHCFAGRSSTEGMVLDLSPLSSITVGTDGTALIGAGARLGAVYRLLHAEGRALPAGCGATVGIAGLALGGGIGLLGRLHGLTCDQLLGARVVLADATVVDCDANREPELFWALRGAGGGQFGVVTSFRFATVPEPNTLRVEAHWASGDSGELISAWQRWAPDAAVGLTLNLTIERKPDEPVPAIRLFGASTMSEATTHELLDAFLALTPATTDLRVSGPMPYSTLKETLSDDGRSSSEHSVRIRSEFFDRPVGNHAIAALLDQLSYGTGGHSRRLTFTATGGAYNRVDRNATAFAHRGERFLLEHVGAPEDPWVDASWEAAHPHSSGRVYPNFPDPALKDPLRAYHAENGPRLSAVKRRYDPGRFFGFAQAIPPAGAEHPTDDDTKKLRA